MLRVSEPRKAVGALVLGGDDGEDEGDVVEGGAVISGVGGRCVGGSVGGSVGDFGSKGVLGEVVASS